MREYRGAPQVQNDVEVEEKFRKERREQGMRGAFLSPFVTAISRVQNDG